MANLSCALYVQRRLGKRLPCWRIKHSVEANLEYLQWDDYHNAPSCMDKVKFADAAIPIGKMTQSHTGLLRDSLGKASSTDIEETEDGFVEWKFKWEIEHSVRTYGWFFIAADCALEQFNARVTPMTYEIRLLNPGNTHLPVSRMLIQLSGFV